MRLQAAPRPAWVLHLENGSRMVRRMLRQDAQRAVFHLAVNVVAGSVLVPRPLRTMLYRWAGMRIPLSSNVFPGVWFRTCHVRFGERVGLNTGVRFDNKAEVVFGDDAGAAMDVLFITDSHEIGPSRRRFDGADRVAPIHVGAGAWIGARSVVLPGVTIGPGCVVAAGSVVTRDLDGDAVYAGVPARKLRDL